MWRGGFGTQKGRRKKISLQLLAAQLHYAVDPFPSVHRFQCHQYPHPRCDLEHRLPAYERANQTGFRGRHRFQIQTKFAALCRFHF
jgi:hypothetical protein